MSDNRRFEKGSGVYTCSICGKKTRETGLEESDYELCAYCFEEMVWDYSVTTGKCRNEFLRETKKETEHYLCCSQNEK